MHFSRGLECARDFSHVMGLNILAFVLFQLKYMSIGEKLKNNVTHEYIRDSYQMARAKCLPDAMLKRRFAESTNSIKQYKQGEDFIAHTCQGRIEIVRSETVIKFYFVLYTECTSILMVDRPDLHRVTCET